jgi:ABC-type branched-subunit amino acid transport system ATPase component
MVRKIPPEAFHYYAEMGVGRSYQAVADHYHVSKVAVTKRAKKENWQSRLLDLEGEARKEADKKAVDSLEVVHARQLKASRYLQSKAVEAMKSLPPEKAIKAAAALNIGWKHELLLLGEPTERHANVEEIIKRETRELLRLVDDGEQTTTG